MDIERKESLPCIALDFRTRLFLENNCIDPITKITKEYEDKIAYEMFDEKTKTVAYSFKDGSIVIFQKDVTGIVDPELAFKAYMYMLLNGDGMKKPPPNIDAIKKEVSQKLKDLKRRSRGDHS